MVNKQDRFKNFRNYLRKLMARCQVTAYGLAQLAGIDPSTIYRVLKGERIPSRDTVFRLAQALFEYSAIVNERDAQRLVDLSGYPPPRRRLFGQPET